MAFFNYVTKEITLKVVYYGPGLSGKTTNLQYLYSVLDPSSRGKFISLATESDRTLFFDFLPVELGKIKDFSVRFQLYTVPGQIRYNATRKLVLKGADAVVFVADSQRDLKEQNLESLANMRENLLSNNVSPDGIPVVIQYNKRDLPNILSTEELRSDLNKKDYQDIEAVAVNGKGVEETFRLVTKMLLKDIIKKHKVDIAPPKEQVVSGPVPEKPAPEKRLPVRDTISLKVPDKAAVQELPHLKDPLSLKSADKAADEELPRVKDTISLKIPDREVFGSDDSPVMPKTVQQRQETTPDSTAYPHAMLTTLATSTLPEISQSLVTLKDTLTALTSELKTSGKRQAEMVRLLEEISTSLAQNKRKRRWFHSTSL
ncbi:MAG TPA: GTPase domain-containing protein [Thermodesulfovibrionales bacterium]|nr:GTPase domain-containing protein [Thermodesulfovibrionales bacterium]